MFAEYLFAQSYAAYNSKLLFIDIENLDEKTDYSSFFSSQGFEVIHYIDDLHFRIFHETAMTDSRLCLVVAKANTYIPYDIQQRFTKFIVSFNLLFPRLNAECIKSHTELNLDLLVTAYQRNFDNWCSFQLTECYISELVCCSDNVQRYVRKAIDQLLDMCRSAKNYLDWQHISDLKSKLDVISAQHNLAIQSEQINAMFAQFILRDFGKLSSEINHRAPVLVSRAMEFIHDHSDRFVIIVMDGMSQFDWQIIAENLKGIKYTKAECFAMIPTTTSVSRQCLLSNKFPSQLLTPWTQSNEKKEFINCANELGYLPTQIAYARGYDVEFSSSIRCGAVIINDIDDMVHGQHQGRVGMYNDVSLLSRQHKLRELISRLINDNFDVYISADHGNVPCTGIGKLMGTGVDVETKSRRMLVLKDFGDKESMMQKYDLYDYPKYYLNKAYDYLICKAGSSFDSKGEEVMSHGGITIEEVIVPFITIKAGDNNG